MNPFTAETKTKIQHRPIANEWEWQHLGSCHEFTAKYFFNPEYERGVAKKEREQRAKAICAHCPVLAHCRDFALTQAEPYGIWGGMNAEERMRYLLSHRNKEEELVP
ncbi:WhiB family transcriptional regulator [Corynebacterium sp. ES2794-CONJ1]|uniref:WhiB family transcriptional regulator n=1 Tax=unclassified Corynebacterium TaxID=2624378 RepID=UPI0021674549|nr:MULTISPECIES: WhiB family transcriptional regulator [unclassified Corynebacterium]MCS4489567.1 WhiB family transcriptional regulator [Corynebacterium sp. ES2775-CONJ]MCS4491422.1 WhiB family transcriptional regulator [Corynebacterium sp. ES2715-CONJ3]MCS4531477.1 WhiB family transcriptional regulator [Corynebacterium sp. ES2730-CONJ]MCU9518865.1 WhiB family transcriptional regulator [Corynebacterium sp. ES2794-CONJ1]